MKEEGKGAKQRERELKGIVDRRGGMGRAGLKYVGALG